MKQVTKALSALTLASISHSSLAVGDFFDKTDRFQVVMLLGISAILLLVLAVLLRRLSFFKQRLDVRTDQLVSEQDQRVRAEVLLKQAQGSVDKQVQQRTEELEKSNLDLLASTNRMKQLVAFDELTELPNASQFDSVVEVELSRALREGKPVSLLVCEVDFFDNYLESYGTERADSTIKSVASCTKKIFRRAGDVVARCGDKQFSVIYSADSSSAIRFAERLQKAIWQIPIPHDSSEIADRVTVSIGLVTIPPSRVFTPQETFELAKTGLKKAKKQGGNQYVQQSPEPTKPTPASTT
ncbi:MAG: GGDEF domain-containing protein [Pseudomonadota bacterium]